MSTTNEIMDLASEWAQETKDFGHLDVSRPRDALLKAVEALAADAEFGRSMRLSTIIAAMKGETK